MSGRLAGKVALVTAAGQGIGRAVALAFLAEGAVVHATDLDPAKLAGLAGAHPAALDVRSTAAVEALARRIGPVDVLANVAGVVHHGAALETSDEELALAFDLNAGSVLRTARAFLPGMIARGRGSIVNVASVASSVKGVPLRCAYGASKAAVIGLTRSIAADYVSAGVRCNAVCPGTVQSPSLDERIAGAARARGITEAEARAGFVARQPLGRLGTAEEVAALVLHLASDESAFTTGAVMVIDGGYSA